MDWIPALLKHLGLSKSVVAAGFVTSVVLYAGPRIAPAYVDPVPREWSPVVVAVLVFSGFLLLLWAAGGVWARLRSNMAAASAAFASHQLNQLEMQFLHALGENPSEPLNLERVDYTVLQLSRLEVLELVDGLRRKGLVSLNPYSLELVSLTSNGRQRALDIQRAAKGSAT